MIIKPDTEYNRKRAEAYRDFAGAVEIQLFEVQVADWHIELIFEIDGKRKMVATNSSIMPSRFKTPEEFQAGWKEAILNKLRAMKPHAAYLIDLYGADV